MAYLQWLNLYQPKVGSSSETSPMQVHNEKCPRDVLIDRERRMSIAPTLNQAILGDPLPGRSALDKRRPHLVHSQEHDR